MQLPIGAPGAIPQSSAIETHSDRSGSWIRAGSSSGDLLYVANEGNIFIYTYPSGERVGTITGKVGQNGLCSDSKGNVFTSTINGSGESSTIYEYAHGGTSPIATLNDPGIAFGCAVDPTSGNLAVANVEDYHAHDGGDIAIFPSAAGTPIVTRGFFRNYFCAYDAAGNLYVTGLSFQSGGKAVLGRLAKRGLLVEIALDKPLYHNPFGFFPSVQWDGRRVTVSSAIVKPKVNPVFEVYRLSIKGTTAKVVGTTALATNGPGIHLAQISIRGATLLAPYNKRGLKTGFWSYPAGGTPSKKIAVSRQDGPLLWGLTVSVAPSGARLRE